MPCLLYPTTTIMQDAPLWLMVTCSAADDTNAADSLTRATRLVTSPDEQACASTVSGNCFCLELLPHTAIDVVFSLYKH